MPETLGTAVLELTTDSSKLDKGLGDAHSKASGLAGALGDVTKIATGFVVGQGLLQLGGMLADGFGDAIAAEQIMAQTKAVIESTGGAAGLTADQIADMAGEFQKVTTFGDDVVQTGENLLLTFTGIGKDVFPQATETMLDMSQALGQDVKSSAIQLGKALNDPIQGMTALSRVGVSFTEDQKKQIKVLQESGDVVGAQKVILAELNKEFGGAAKAAGGTFAGQVIIAKNAIGELFEGIARKLMPGLAALLAILADKLPDAIETIEQGIDKLGGKVEELWGVLEDKGVVAAVAAGLMAIGEGLEVVGDKIANIDMGDFADQWAKLEPAVTIMIGLFGPLLRDILVELWDALVPIANTVKNDLIPALAGLEPIMKPLAIFAGVVALGPLYLLLQAIKFLIPPIGELANVYLKLLSKEIEAVGVVIAALAVAFDVSLKAIMSVFGTFKALFTGDWDKLWADVKAAAELAWTGIEKAAGLAWEAIKAAIMVPVDAWIALFKTELTAIATFLDTTWGLIESAAGAAWGLIKSAVMTPVTDMRDAVLQVGTDIKDGFLNSFTAMLTGISELAGTAWSAANNLGGQLMDGLKSALSSGASIAGDIGSAVLAAVKGAANNVIDRVNRALEFSFDTHIPGVGSIRIDPWDIDHLAGGLWEAPGTRGMGDILPALISPGEMVLDVASADALRSMVTSGAGRSDQRGGVTLHVDRMEVNAQSPEEARRGASNVAWGFADNLRRRGAIA